MLRILRFVRRNAYHLDIADSRAALDPDVLLLQPLWHIAEKMDAQLPLAGALDDLYIIDAVEALFGIRLIADRLPAAFYTTC
jgi:hypothetical protein